MIATGRQIEDGALHGSRSRKIYVLAILVAVYFFHQLDRSAIQVGQELFKAEFRLSDSQVGFIIGVVYSTTYALTGIPLGLIIDRVNRAKLLGSLVVTWSIMTMLSGLASSAWHLALARAVVGAAESGSAPTSLSILSSIFSDRRRATVISIFFAGSGVGAMVSFALGGYLAATWGWRAVFLVCGPPGVLLGVIIALTVPEYKRVATTAQAASSVSGWAARLQMLGHRSVFPVYAGALLFCISQAGVAAWIVAFFSRVHNFSTASAGLATAVIYGLGTVGGLVSGVVSDAAERRWRGGTMTVMGIAALLNMAFGLIAVLATGGNISFAMFCCWGLFGLVYSALTSAAISRIVPPEAHGFAFAIFAVSTNLIGAGFGPLLTGFLSDLFAPKYGPLSIQPAMITLLLVQPLAALSCFIAASRSKDAAHHGLAVANEC